MSATSGNEWTLNAVDHEYLHRLRDRIPDRVFDAHFHLYRSADFSQKPAGVFAGGPDVVDTSVWRAYVGEQIGVQRLAGGLCFPVPRGNPADINPWFCQEIAQHPENRGLLLASPGDSYADIAPYLEKPHIAGFKPYHVYADVDITFEAQLSEYIPEWAWEEANRRGWIIMLHLVRARALNDPDNQEALRHYCARYPEAKVILAHAARGFCADNTVEGIHSIADIRNIWFDSSGICEPAPLRAILRTFGPRRLLFGTDFPICEGRGKAVTVGDNFAWINPEHIDVHPDSPTLTTCAVGVENLRALFDACDEIGLNAEDHRDIFYHNAVRLLGLEKPTGTETQTLYRKAKELIPAGGQLLSKRPEMHAPDQWPAYFHEARGCEVWDIDGNYFYDMSLNSVGAALLGVRDPDVTKAVQRRLTLGAISTLNPKEEVDLAERLCNIHPWAEQARFARTGGEMAAVAVRIARATTDRSKVAICGYHGWTDWYIAANLGDSDALRGHLLPGLNPLGVPRELRGTALPFTYNNKEALDAIIAEHGHDLAAVVMEPCRSEDPEPGFLEYVREQARKCGAVLIFDEITVGWRRTFGGAHLRLGVTPDMAMFGKTLGNGHPIAAVIGTRAAMEGAHSSFISSSYWSEAIGPAAALATLDKMERIDAVDIINKTGTAVMNLIRQTAERHHLPIRVTGYPCAPKFSFDHDRAMELTTLYTQEMLGHGFLAKPHIYITVAHTTRIIDTFAEALDSVFATIAQAIAADNIARYLKGPVAHSGFKRLI